MPPSSRLAPFGFLKGVLETMRKTRTRIGFEVRRIIKARLSVSTDANNQRIISGKSKPRVKSIEEPQETVEGLI